MIRRRKRSAHTPIIFITAFADEVRQAEGYAQGAVDYIPAPVDCTTLDGETSVVNVNHGADVPGGFFVIIHNKNGATPTAFVHTYGSGLQEKINVCAATPVAPCFTWDAATTTATIYTIHNGSYTKLH